jgi:hypothetical protein
MFNRPDFKACISNGDGTSECDSETIDNMNHITIDIDKFEEIYNYCEDKEYRLFICLKYPKQCK